MHLCVYIVMTREEYNHNVDVWADCVYRFARRCCKDDERCKDAVQDAFANLWEHRKEISVIKGKQWLFSVVHNKLISQYRHDRVAEKMFVDTTDSPVVDPDFAFDIKDAIRFAMDLLPPIQRECLQLRDVEGYHYKEIADILNISVQQVQVYIFRARVSLQKTLKEYRQ